MKENKNHIKTDLCDYLQRLVARSASFLARAGDVFRNVGLVTQRRSTDHNCDFVMLFLKIMKGC